MASIPANSTGAPPNLGGCIGAGLPSGGEKPPMLSSMASIPARSSGAPPMFWGCRGAGLPSGGEEPRMLSSVPKRAPVQIRMKKYWSNIVLTVCMTEMSQI